MKDMGMFRKFALVVGVVGVIGLGGLSLTNLMTSEPADAAGGIDKEAVEAIIHDYLLENPEIILEAVQKLQQREEAESEARIASYIAANLHVIESDAGSFVAGNPDGDVTIVEFFDYHCTYCKRSLTGLMNVVEEDKNIKLVLREFPVLGPESTNAAKAAVASIELGGYMAFHLKMMESKGKLTQSRIEDLAVSVGLDLAELSAALQDPKVGSVIDDNLNMAHALGINGTPAFILDGKIYHGMRSGDDLRALVAEARKSDNRS